MKNTTTDSIGSTDCDSPRRKVFDDLHLLAIQVKFTAACVVWI
jgi:hypothetical protein